MLLYKLSKQIENYRGIAQRSRKVIKIILAPRSLAADAVRPSLIPKESTMVLEEEEHRMQVPVILETKAALAILEKL